MISCSMSVILFLIVVFSVSASHASEIEDNITWTDMEIKINALLAKQKDEIENKFNNLISEQNREIEERYDSLLRSHISLEHKYRTMDKLTIVLRDQNQKLQQQVLELENIASRNRNDNYRKISKPSNSPKRNVMASMLTGYEREHVNKTLVARQQLPEQRTTRPGTYSLQNINNKRLLVQDKPTTAPTVSPLARVAFHARMSQKLVNPGDNQHLEFDSVRTNVGNGYHSGTSTFICPVSGTYVFSVTMLSLPDKYLESVIVLNGNELAYVYAYNDHYYNSGSNMVIVDLNVNDEVWVRVRSGEHHTGTVAERDWSTFSGFILWPNL